MYKILTILLIFFIINSSVSAADKHQIKLGSEKELTAFVFNGVLNTKENAISIKKDINSLYSKTVNNIIEIITSGDKEKILELWKPSERNKIYKSMENKIQFENNTAFFRNIIETKLIAVIDHRGHLLVYVDHKINGIDSYIKCYPLIILNGDLLLSNDLASDYFFSKLADEIIRGYWK